jgi:hypothetical protein
MPKKGKTMNTDAPAADQAAAAAPAAPPKPALETQNGVTKPAEGTKTRKVWDTANTISAEKKRPALRDEVMTALLADGMSKGTIATQYGRWCTFYGVDKASRAAARAAEKPATPAAPPAT